jgi:ABC-type branched-subunit amino acid transport system substrate-binding protein
LLPFKAAYGYGDSFSAGKFSASAMTVALERINNDPYLLPNHHINLVWNDTECNEEKSIRLMAAFIEQRVDAFIGFACKCITQARIAASLNLMVISPVSIFMI